MKTILQALVDEIHYPVPEGFVENTAIRRGLDKDGAYTQEVSLSSDYKGAVADCLCSLLHSVNFSEADKSIGALSDKDKERILVRANSIYTSIGEPEVETVDRPIVHIGG